MDADINYPDDVIADLKEIKNKWDILQQHPYGVYVPTTNYTKRFEVSTQSYALDARNFITNVVEFANKHEGILNVATNVLGSTINREISYAELYTDSSKKKKCELITLANNQLKRDLFKLFEILENLEQQNKL